jgi:two-component system, NtrC family, sensor histidine kinase KinB
MTLRQKLLLAQAPLGAAVALLGLVAALTIASLGERTDEILRENYRSVLAMQRIKESLERMDSAALFLVAGQRERGLAQVRRHRPHLEAELLVEEGNITEPGEAAAAARLRRAWTDYQARFDQFTALPAASADFYFRQLEPLFLEIKQAADAILDMNQDAMVRKSDRARQAARQMDALVIIAALAALLGGLFASTQLTARLLRPLDALRRITRRIGEGDYEVEADARGTDEIASLATDFNAMTERLKEYKKSSLGKLLQAQKASQAAIDSLPDPVIIFDPGGELLASNRAVERLLKPEPRPNAPLSAEPSLRGALERVSAYVLSGKGPYTPKGYEEALRVSGAEGERYFLPRANPVYGEDGAVLGVTVLLQDVTRLRRFDELKNDLVATVAHEFRTPLTSLRMAIHLCLEQAAGPLNEKQADLLYAAREDTERLQGTVDELLDLARIQAGRLELAPRPTAPEALLQGAVEAHRAAGEERQIRLVVEAPPGLGEARADPERIGLVLGNLLSNALRYTPDGGAIELSAKAVPGATRFAVRDHGPGIPKELQGLIFEKFVQLPGAAPGAAGFGLFLAREIVKAHGGEIGVESEPGKGAEFWFTLPTEGA